MEHLNKKCYVEVKDKDIFFNTLKLILYEKEKNQTLWELNIKLLMIQISMESKSCRKWKWRIGSQNLSKKEKDYWKGKTWFRMS